MRQPHYATARRAEISGGPATPGYICRGTKRSRGAERAGRHLREMGMVPVAPPDALRDGCVGHQPSAPWASRMPRQCGEEPQALRPGPSHHRPPHLVSTRGYLVTTGVMIRPVGGYGDNFSAFRPERAVFAGDSGREALAGSGVARARFGPACAGSSLVRERGEG